MAVVENDPIDGPCLRERLTTWAGFGTYVPILLHHFANSHGF